MDTSTVRHDSPLDPRDSRDPLAIGELPAFDLLSIQGPDSRKFLQGQLTCNLERLSETHSMRGAYCNLKGRVIADFRLFLRGDTVCLRTEAGMGITLKQALDKYIVFSKAKIAISEGVRRFGLVGETSATALAALFAEAPRFALTATDDAYSDEEISVVRAEGPARFELFLFGDSPFALEQLTGLIGSSTRATAMMDANATNTANEFWQLADIQAGVLHITPELQELYTPQVLNYDLQGLIDFKKGCYTGQEIVARMHYRGTAKRRLYRLQSPISLLSSLPTGEPITVPVTAAEMTGAAELLRTAHGPAQSLELLAILPCEMAGTTDILSAEFSDKLKIDLRVIPISRHQAD